MATISPRKTKFRAVRSTARESDRIPKTSGDTRRWYAFFTSFTVLTIAFGFALFCWPALYRPLTRAHGWSFAAANAGGAIVLFLIGVLSPVVGALVDIFRPKRVILAGIVVVAGALALLSTVQSLPQYYAFCCLLGIGASGVSILPASILTGNSFSTRRGIAIGFINAGIGLGGFIAPRLTTAQIAQRGVSGVFLSLAACMAIPFLLTLLVSEGDMAHNRPEPGRVPTMRELIRMPMFWIFGVALFLTAHAMLGVQQNLISYLTSAKVAAKDAAFVLAVALGATSPGKILSGFVVDRFHCRAAIAGSGICVALGILALLNIAPQSGALYGMAILFGLGYGGIFNAVPAIVFEYFGTRQTGKAFGLFYVFFGLGASSGGELAGFLFDKTQRWPVPFSVDLGLACVSLLLLATSMNRLRPAARTRVSGG